MTNQSKENNSPGTDVKFCLVSYKGGSHNSNKIFPTGEILYRRGKNWKRCTGEYVKKLYANPNEFQTLRVRHEDEEKKVSYRKINIVAFGRTEEECLPKTVVEKARGRGKRLARKKDFADSPNTVYSPLVSTQRNNRTKKTVAKAPTEDEKSLQNKKASTKAMKSVANEVMLNIKDASQTKLGNKNVLRKNSMDTSAKTPWRDASDFGPNPVSDDYKKEINITNSGVECVTDGEKKRKRGGKRVDRIKKKPIKLNYGSSDDDPGDGVRKSDASDAEDIIEQCTKKTKIPAIEGSKAIKRNLPKVVNVEVFQAKTCKLVSSMIASIAKMSQKNIPVLRERNAETAMEPIGSTSKKKKKNHKKTVALKRQQAAENAIASSMAKVAKGQKLKRLPPGKIFGMSVTEPNSTRSSRLSKIATDQSILTTDEGSSTSRDNDEANDPEESPINPEVTSNETSVQSPEKINSTRKDDDDKREDKEYKEMLEIMEDKMAEKDKKLDEVRKITRQLEDYARKLKKIVPENNEETESKKKITEIPKPKKGEKKTLLFEKWWDYELVLKAVSCENINARIIYLINALWCDQTERMKFVLKKRKNCNEDLVQIPSEDLIAIKNAAESFDGIKSQDAENIFDMAYYKKVISNALKCERQRHGRQRPSSNRSDE